MKGFAPVAAVVLMFAFGGCGDDDDTTSGTGGTGGGTAGTPAAGAGGTGTGGGGAVGGGPGGEDCPYTVSSFSCDTACTNLIALADKCKDDPSLDEYTKMVLAGAAVGTGAGCKATCAVDSINYRMQWECFQGTPVDAECTAIAGCSADNCPPVSEGG